MIDIPVVFNIKTFLMPETIQKLSFEGPLLVDDFYSLTSLDVVVESSLEPTNSCLKIEPIAVSFIVLHHAFIYISIFEDDYGFSCTLFAFELSNIHLVWAKPYDFQVLSAIFHLWDKLFIKRSVSE